MSDLVDKLEYFAAIRLMAERVPFGDDAQLFLDASGRILALQAEVERLTAREKGLRAFIADDGYAASFQSLGQYRTALLAALVAGKETT